MRAGPLCWRIAGANAAGLDHRALGRQVAEQDRQPAASGVCGFSMRADHFVILDLGIRRSTGRSVVPVTVGPVQVQRVARACDLVQDGRDAAGAVDVFHVPVPGRADLAQVRHPVGHGVDALQRIVDAGFVGQRQRVQDGVGAAAHRHIQREGIVDRFGGDDLPRGDVCARPAPGSAPRRCRASASRSAVCASAEPLYGSASPRTSIRQFMELAVNMPEHEPQDGQAIFFQHLQPRCIDLARPGYAPTPSNTEIRSIASPSGVLPGRHRPAGDEDRRDVHPHGRHQHARHDLVAVGDADHAVELVRLDHRLDAVGDQLARGQAIFHARVTHGDPVVHADGVELERHTAGRAHGFFDPLAELLQVHVPGDDINIGIDNGDEGLFEIRFSHTGGAQQRPVRSSFITFFNLI